MNRESDNLQQLGRKTEYKMTYAPEVLETFVNKHQENDYWVQFNCPEFTSLCPITGQPDFAEIKIAYIPAERMVESKSLKLCLRRVAASAFIRTPTTGSRGPNTKKWRKSACSTARCSKQRISRILRIGRTMWQQ